VKYADDLVLLVKKKNCTAGCDCWINLKWKVLWNGNECAENKTNLKGISRQTSQDR
jgi:hypothetical protein